MVVTPRAGVWIEISRFLLYLITPDVTPRAGVWIEIKKKSVRKSSSQVTPRAGVWIEICINGIFLDELGVTPRAGVWIEINMILDAVQQGNRSLPVRECGLKSYGGQLNYQTDYRSLPVRECGLKYEINETDINPPTELGRLADASGDKQSTRI